MFSIRSGLAAALLLTATSVAAQQACGPAELLTDDAGDWDGTFGALVGVGAGLPQQDVLGLTLEQSAAGGEILLTFRIVTAAGPVGVLPPNAAWFTSFETPDGVVYGVRLQTDPAGVGSYFSYVGGASNAGNVDGRFVEADTEKPAEAGDYGADGVIAITVKAANVGITGPGQVLGPFNAASVQSVPLGVIAATVDEAPQGLGRDGFFDIQGGCAGKAAALAFGAGAMPLAALLPLVIVALALPAGAARRRRFRHGMR